MKYPQSVMIWGAMSGAGVGKLCFLKSKVTATVYQNVLEDFMIPSAEDLYGDADFIFKQDLAPTHTARSNKIWFDAHAITVLDWPANSPDLNLRESTGYSQEENEGHQTQQQRRADSKHQGNLGFHNSQAMPQADCLNATLHRGSD